MARDLSDLDGQVAVKQFATEWAEFGILVNAIATASVLTEPATGLLDDPAFSNTLVQRILLGRVGAPGDLVGAPVFFLSPASEFITGQTLFIDGSATTGQ